jgi:hypothetical protein
MPFAVIGVSDLHITNGILGIILVYNNLAPF